MKSAEASPLRNEIRSIGSIGCCCWSRRRIIDKAVVLIMFVVNATEQFEAYRVIMNNERRKHTVINSIRQFDRGSVAMLLMMHSACIIG